MGSKNINLVKFFIMVAALLAALIFLTGAGKAAAKYVIAQNTYHTEIIKHTVKEGQTAYGIAIKHMGKQDYYHRTSDLVEDMKAANGWNKVPKLAPGDVVVIPLIVNGVRGQKHE